MRYEALREVAVTHFVKYVERVDQQALVPCRWIGDRVDVGGVFCVTPAFEA